MKHHILVKWKDSFARPDLGEIEKIFKAALTLPGLHEVNLYPNIIDRPNRYDLLIVVDMDKEALEAYDGSEAHLQWKQRYGDKIAAKAIFDCE